VAYDGGSQAAPADAARACLLAPGLREAMLARDTLSGRAGRQVIMNGPSHRPNKRPKNPTDKPAKPLVR
jgi:hypothetical protein